jgi:hypothetical protein
VAAAAAAIFVGAIRGGGDETTTARAGDSLEAAPEASLIESNHNYTGDELAALAGQYVSSSAALSGGATSNEGGSPPVPAATAPPETAFPAPASPAPNRSPTRTLPGGATDQDPRACIDLGSGVTADLQLLYLEAARYEGQDAYIGIFGTQNSSGNPVALVVAVTRTDCSPLYFGRQTG